MEWVPNSIETEYQKRWVPNNIDMDTKYQKPRDILGVQLKPLYWQPSTKRIVLAVA